MEQELPPPGWYPDPAGGDNRRYWDGTRWTTHVEPAPAVAPIPPPPQPSEPQPEAFSVPVIASAPAEPAPEPQPFAMPAIPSAPAEPASEPQPEVFSVPAIPSAPAEPAPEPQPFVPLDVPQAGGDAHAGDQPEPEPEPELFVPLHIPEAGGGAHGGPAPEPEPEPEKFVPLEVPAFGAPDPATAAVPPTPPGPPTPATAVPPSGGSTSGSRRKLAIAGAVAALVVFAGFAAVTVIGTEAPSADGAYEACQDELSDTGMQEGEVEFQPEERITIESVDGGVALEFWVDDEVSRAFFRCAVDTSGAEPQVEDMWVNLSELMDLIDPDASVRFDSVGNSISG